MYYTYNYFMSVHHTVDNNQYVRESVMYSAYNYLYSSIQILKQMHV